jgi:lysozyme
MRKPATAAAAATLAAAVAFIAPWEGVELKAYRDIVGVPTICYGETRGVEMGDTATLAECKTMLAKGVQEFWVAMDPCLPDGLPVKTNAAFLSFSYNLGPKILCTSPTMSALLKKGKVAEACTAMQLFDKAGGETVRGLTRRRAAESKLCLEGLAG